MYRTIQLNCNNKKNYRVVEHSVVTADISPSDTLALRKSSVPHGDISFQGAFCYSHQKGAITMAIISCPECSGNVSDMALQCPHCGYPIHSVMTKSEKKERRSRRRRKLPNGFGSIKKLSGPRRRPFAAYPPMTEYKLNGVAKSVPAIGYFATYQAAYDALSTYRRNPYDIELANATFAEVYEMWFTSFTNGPKEKSASTIGAYKSAYNNCEALHDKKIRDIRKYDMQNVLDNCELGYSSLANIKKLFSQVFKFAKENDIIEKDYTEFVTINKEDDNEKGEPFSPDELKILWENREDTTVGMIILMIFTGYRISEFETNTKNNYKLEINTEDRYFKGGLKTKNGKGRIVPYNEWLIPYVNLYSDMQQDFQANKFRAELFYPKLQELGIDTTASGKKHTPHDCRHTFSWICDRVEMDELSKHLIMGHSLGNDVEKSIYGHRTLEDLQKAMSKITLEEVLLICH